MIRVQDIITIMEHWAPPALAFERDNTGLQIGSQKQHVTKILVTLDVNLNVIEEAHQKKAELIISHHPVLFHPLKSVSPDERIGAIITLCAKYGIAVFSAHTNLDFTHGGVSFALAERLGLTQIDPLLNNHRVSKKVVVFVPPDHLENVRTAMAEAGAGTIGNYSGCSFGMEGIGTFKPNATAKPFIGNIGTQERVREIRLEMICPAWQLDTVIRTMKKSHPYEEVAFDIYDLATTNASYGAGAIGILRQPMNSQRFLTHIARTLKVPALRYTGALKHPISRVAVCGGSGSDLVTAAHQHNADAFVTADISYHRFEEIQNRLLMIDAGHFETEVPIVPKICSYLNEKLKNKSIEVLKSKIMKNNVQYFTA